MNPRGQRRRSVRLKGFDYSLPGRYFVTIVTHRRECLFGRIENEEMQLNDQGRIVEECWLALPEHFTNVKLGPYVVMPNHVHGIIEIMDEERRGEVISPRWAQNLHYPGGETPPLRKPTLGQIVAYFKYRSTKEMNLLDGSGVIAKIWQHNYGACPECSEGNTSSETPSIGIESTATSNPTRPCGRKTTKIRPT